jgi:ankyrin repeat protein
MTADGSTIDVPLGRLLSVAPGLPSSDIARTVEHYERIGFALTLPVRSELAAAEFAIMERDRVELHFALKPEHDPRRTAMWIYVGVEDADTIAEEFDLAGAAQGRTPRDTDYGMRELAHIDPDGNLLLFGSPLRDPAGTPRPPALRQQARSRDDRAAFEFATAIKRGDVHEVERLLERDPGLATSVINSRWPLHLLADAPGHRPNAAGIAAALVAAGAELDAHATGTWHHETALHWAASNDDVELIDALLDAGADIEHPGSSISGGPPLQSAVGYAQWAAARRLAERGAILTVFAAAALGIAPELERFCDASPAPPADDLSGALWNAARAGQQAAAAFEQERGADLNWRAPWSGETPLDAARGVGQDETAAWLLARGAVAGAAGQAG